VGLLLRLGCKVAQTFNCRSSPSEVLSLIAVLVAYLWSKTRAIQDIQDREPSPENSPMNWNLGTSWFFFVFFSP